MSSIALTAGSGARWALRPLRESVAAAVTDFPFFWGVVLMLAANSLWAIGPVRALAPYLAGSDFRQG